MVVLVDFVDAEIIFDPIDLPSTGASIVLYGFTFSPALSCNLIMLTPLFAFYPLSKTRPATIEDIYTPSAPNVLGWCMSRIALSTFESAHASSVCRLFLSMTL
ncbi:hypothetical protein PISMIDRAFT_671876 [Pisolithus microcarpus 441]|uniref:Uncharacterized protein n=1 Tax=Pisolithus microcarpus 441 TaxID=765257 RepID=A0A0D0A621_9AGAM|nr:hypothetical protein BKA83DRAFT_671876 [Pisolithus microcarpus]KIK29897.1 hypothetical protein PISMIDRAFT_671876 [Pisolithus microcarpus 441]